MALEILSWGLRVIGLDDHPALVALDLVDFLGLDVDGQVAVDDPDSSLLGESDGHPGFGDRVHGRADEWEC